MGLNDSKYLGKIFLGKNNFSKNSIFQEIGGTVTLDDTKEVTGELNIRSAPLMCSTALGLSLKKSQNSTFFSSNFEKNGVSVTLGSIFDNKHNLRRLSAQLTSTESIPISQFLSAKIAFGVVIPDT